MLSYIFSNSELSQLFRFLSPNWLQVTSARSIFQLIKQLKDNHSNLASWEQTKIATEKNFSHLGVSVNGKIASPSLGSCALTLFFAQVLFQDTWILDLRSDSFSGAPNNWSWHPKKYYYEVKPNFLQGIRDLYRGFYRDDPQLFDEALELLQLKAAKEALRKHFGTGNQSNVRFQLATFQSTFAEVFDCCVREKIKLDPDFFILGFMLLGLYENLEKSGDTYDVRSIFSGLDLS